MTWQFNIYALLLILSSILSGWLAVTVWRRQVAGSNSFTLLLLLLTIWSLAYGVELTQTDLATILWVIRIEYLGMVPSSIMWLVFVLQYVGLDKWVTRRNLILLFIIPVVVVLSNWTNPFHGLYYAEVGLTSSRGMILFDRVPGVMYWVSVTFSYAANLVATLLLVQFFFRSPRPYRYQAGIALTAALIPWTSNIIYNSGLSPLPSGLDISPLSFTLTSLIFAWGMFRFKLLDVVPVARSTLVNTMEDAWIVLDTKDRLVDLNPAAQQVLPEPTAAVIGLPAAVVWADRPDLVARFRENKQMQAEISLGEGSDRRFYDVKTSPLTNRQGRVTGRLIVLRDITDYKEAVEAAEAANQAKTTFLAMMSHELRTPLNGILGYAQVLQRDPALGSRQQKQAATIERSGEHLLLLINDVLDIAKVEAGKVGLHKAAFDLHLFLHQVCEIARAPVENKGVAFRLETGNGLPTAVYGDEQRLRQVLMNLLDNAAKFTDRGEVVLRVSSSVPPVAAPSAVSLRFEVTDTGIGIAPEDLEAIFEPFERAGLTPYKRVGTGLGLGISRSLVDLMGGTLQVNSRPGQGSRFWFEIPIELAFSWERDTGVPLPHITGYKGKRRTILIVDNVAESRAVLVDLLSPLGFKLLEAENGQAGLVTAVAARPDAIITDLLIPEIDGHALIYHIRQETALANTPIIAISASVYDEDRRQSLLAGADAFLAKPVRAGEMLTQLQRRLALQWLDETIAEETPPPPCQPPPCTDLTALHELALQGDVVALREKTDALAYADTRFVPFVVKLQGMLDIFQINEICGFLEAQLSLNSGDALKKHE